MHFKSAIPIVLAIYGSVLHAAPVNPDHDLPAWNKHSNQEKMAYAVRASLLCQTASCAPLSLKRCLDEIARPPIPEAARREAIGSVAVQCILMLNK